MSHILSCKYYEDYFMTKIRPERINRGISIRVTYAYKADMTLAGEGYKLKIRFTPK